MENLYLVLLQFLSMKKVIMFGIQFVDNDKIIEPARFAIVAAGVLVAINVSATYAFGLLTEELIVRFGFDQSDITTVSTVGTCFGFLSYPAGLLFDNFGPSLVLAVATSLSVSGMLLFSFIFSGYVPGSLVNVAVANALLSIGCSWQDVSSLMPSVLHFPLDKGSVIAIQKTFMGLGSTILSLYHQALFDGQQSEYTLYVAVMIAVHGLVGLGIITTPGYHVSLWRARRLSKEEHAEKHLLYGRLYQTQVGERTRFRIGFALLLVAVVLLATISFVQAYVQLASQGKIALAGISFLISISFFFLALPRTSNSAVEASLIPSSSSLLHDHANNQWIVTPFRRSILACPVLWLMFWTSLCTWGPGIVVISNSTQIFTAINNGEKDSRQCTLVVALMGLFSALGRIAAGASEQLLSRNGKPMLLVYSVAPLATILSMTLFLSVDAQFALPPFAVMSFGFGFSWACTILIVRQTFAIDVAQHYNFCFFGGAFSTVILNRVLFGPRFDEEARSQHTYPMCSGHSCFSVTFFIILVLAVSSAITSAQAYRMWCAKDVLTHSVSDPEAVEPV
jgi:hypothetical protein